jgi:ubiquinone/menaquinone biosynthesis C-methylase UbiE/GNAT superfamily N-acetyltransferase
VSGNPVPPPIDITTAEHAADYTAARALFREYADGLAVDLDFQDFAGELDRLPAMYGPPSGVLLLARDAAGAVGCVGVRRFSDDTCEMKRLFVRDRVRGTGLGRRLAAAAVSAAGRLGYERMVLDTLDPMAAARHVYGSLGFRETSAYYANPLPGVRYFALDLRAPSAEAAPDQTRRVDYDAVAPAYDRRYENRRFAGIEATLRRFVTAPPDVDTIAEVGCGTGHWLASLADVAGRRVGVDASAAMLAGAHANAPGALLVRAGADRLPLVDGSVDRIICMNALHHFPDCRDFAAEARRIVRPGGGILIVGLDPHAALGRWWIYETFPNAHRLDCDRYPSGAAIRELLRDAGFTAGDSVVAEEITAAVPFADAVERGYLDRRSTSQLMVIDDAEYEAGLARLRATEPVLHAEIRLYATTGWAS